MAETKAELAQSTQSSRVVLLARSRSEAKYFAMELSRAGYLSAIVLERGPIPFANSPSRRPSLRSPEGKKWIRTQLRNNLGFLILTEFPRVLYEQVAWRLANVMERRLTSAANGEAQSYQNQPLSFPAGAPLHEVENLNDDASIALLRSLNADYFFVVGTRILCQEAILTAPYGCLNWHPGILPYYRGVYCELFALYNKDYANIGYTIHFVDSGVDSGDIVWQRRITMEADDDFHTLRAKGAMDAARVAPKLFEAIRLGRVTRIPQTGPGRQYFMRDVTPAVMINVITKCLLRRWGLINTPQTPTLAPNAHVESILPGCLAGASASSAATVNGTETGFCNND
jgi:folate-dependent phosphoribosylglycinamide formyltransferase PurN